jgi:hypothetical protein
LAKGKQTITTTIHTELYKMVKLFAINADFKINEVIEIALIRFLKKYQQKEQKDEKEKTKGF